MSRDIGTSFAFNAAREKLTSPNPQTSEWPHRTLASQPHCPQLPSLFLESRGADLPKVLGREDSEEGLGLGPERCIRSANRGRRQLKFL